MAKNKKVEVVEAEVVEENRAVAVVKKTQKPTEGVVVKTIAKQIEVVRGAELRSNFEKLKLGAMVSQAVTLLGMDSKGGNGSKGDGVKGWWEKNFKDKDGEAFIPYRTVHSWVEAARNLPALIGGSASADPDAVMKLLAKNPTKVVGKDAKILESAEKVANGMTMRQMLLWGGDEQAKGRGRKPGSKANSSEVDTHIAKTAEEKAAAAEQEMREIVGTLGAFLTRGGKINMLTAQAKSDFHTSLVDYAKLLEEQM